MRVEPPSRSRLPTVARAGLALLVALACLAPSPARAQACSLSSSPLRGGFLDTGPVDLELAVEIDPGLAFVRLESSQLEVVYAPVPGSVSSEFAIRSFRIKGANQDQLGTSPFQYLDNATGRGPLVEATLVHDGLDRKTVHLEWLVWNTALQMIDPARRIVQEVTLHAHGRFLEIDYLDIEWSINVVDLGRPGGRFGGVHVAHGSQSWVRPLITHEEPPGTYYSRYPPDGVNDPADGGSLAYQGHFVMAVVDPASGQGFGRIFPVAHTHVVKLLLSPSQRNGIEAQHYPFVNPHPPFTGYLYAVTGGEADALDFGRLIVDGGALPALPACGDDLEVAAVPYTNWGFDAWTGDLAGELANPAPLPLVGDAQIGALFSEGPADWAEDFDDLLPGEDPPDFVDTGADTSTVEDDGLFAVFEVAGERVFGTASTATNIHSHLASPISAGSFGYEVSGRLRIDDPDGGIGITAFSQMPQTAAYYRLRRYFDNDFHVSPVGTTVSGAPGAADTGVVPEPDVWYRFRLQVEDTGLRTEIRAMVWEDGIAEPDDWQASVYDDGPTRLRGGTVGLWSFHDGAKYVDDLAVRLFPAQEHQLTVTSNAPGAVLLDPDRTVFTTSETVELTPVPAPGWSFVGWGGDVDATDDPLALVVTSDLTVEARFARTLAEEDFTGLALGADPPGWLDTGAGNSLVEDDALFAVAEVQGDPALGTASTATNVHSHWLDAGLEGQTGYELAGRLWVSDADGGIGVTFFSAMPEELVYYRLRRYVGTDFHLAPVGTSLAGATATGVVPVANAWHRFRVQVEDVGDRTEVRARVWLEGSPEPAFWQADAFDDGPSRRTGGTVGAWSMGPGVKRWDDWTVSPLPAVGPAACDDGADDDGDGLVDLADPGCLDAADLSERAPLLPCDDGVDRDGDGGADFDPGPGLGDPGCAGPGFVTETPICQDGVDNDGLAGTDFDGGVSVLGAGNADPEGADPQCGAPWGQREFAPSRGCGLGPEAAPILALVGWPRRRRRRWRRRGGHGRA